MLRKIMAAAAVSGLALTSAMAQSTTTPSDQSTPSATSTTTTPNPAGKANFMPDARRAWISARFGLLQTEQRARRVGGSRSAIRPHGRWESVGCQLDGGS